MGISALVCGGESISIDDSCIKLLSLFVWLVPSFLRSFVGQVEIQESTLSLCGFVLRISKVIDQSEAFILRPSRLADFMEWASILQQAVDQMTVERELRGSDLQRVARKARIVAASGGRTIPELASSSSSSSSSFSTSAAGPSSSSSASASADPSVVEAAAADAEEETAAAECERREARGRLFRMPGDERRDVDRAEGDSARARSLQVRRDMYRLEARERDATRKVCL